MSHVLLPFRRLRHSLIYKMLACATTVCPHHDTSSIRTSEFSYYISNVYDVYFESPVSWTLLALQTAGPLIVAFELHIHTMREKNRDESGLLCGALALNLPNHVFETVGAPSPNAR